VLSLYVRRSLWVLFEGHGIILPAGQIGAATAGKLTGRRQAPPVVALLDVALLDGVTVFVEPTRRAFVPRQYLFLGVISRMEN